MKKLWFNQRLSENHAEPFVFGLPNRFQKISFYITINLLRSTYHLEALVQTIKLKTFLCVVGAICFPGVAPKISDMVSRMCFIIYSIKLSVTTFIKCL